MGSGHITLLVRRGLDPAGHSASWVEPENGYVHERSVGWIMLRDFELAHEAMTHALFRCIDAPRTPTEQVKALLDGLRESLTLRMVFAGTLKLVPGVYPPALIHAVQIGETLPHEQRLIERYFADIGAQPDPAHVEAVARMRGGPIAVRRQDLVSDADWYASDHVKRLREPGNVDACMYCGFPLEITVQQDPVNSAEDSNPAAPESSGPKPITYIGFSMHRAWGAPQFTEAERDAFARLQSRLAPMMRAWASQRDHGPSVLDLPARLRGVLACLIEGDSEKQVAARLGLSPHTIHQYVKLIHTRMQVRSRGELLSWCAQHGITAESVRSPVQSKNPVPRRSSSHGTSVAAITMSADLNTSHVGEANLKGDAALANHVLLDVKRSSLDSEESPESARGC